MPPLPRLRSHEVRKGLLIGSPNPVPPPHLWSQATRNRLLSNSLDSCTLRSPFQRLESTAPPPRPSSSSLAASHAACSSLIWELCSVS